MTENNYLDIKKMEEVAEAEHQKKADESMARLDEMTEAEAKEQAELNELFAKVVLSDREDAEQQRAAEIEEEKAKAIKAVEDRYENQGLKSDHTKVVEDSYRSLLSNIPGVED